MISRIFRLLICVLAFWVTLKAPSKMCMGAWGYVQNTPFGTVLLASIEHYEWGYFWRVYKRSDLDPFVGIVKTKEQAKSRIYNILLGSRVI